MNIAVIDCNAICYHSHFTTGQMIRSDGTPIGIIYGFFQQLQTIIQQVGTAHLVFAWDSKESKRKELYPEYKAQRTKNREEDPTIFDSFWQFDELHELILPRLGFVNNFQFEGYEGDDIIAQVCKQYKNVTMVTSDQDMYQCLRPGVRMYKPTKGEFYGLADFKGHYGILPEQWVSVKAIAGCPGDNVIGLRGIGEKTVIKYLLDVSGKPYPKIDNKEARKIIARNWPLVCLPFEGTPELDIQFPKMDFQLWKEFCLEYEFNKFMKDAQFWRGVFEYRAPEGYFAPPTKRKHWR